MPELIFHLSIKSQHYFEHFRKKAEIDFFHFLIVTLAMPVSINRKILTIWIPSKRYHCLIFLQTAL